MVERKKKREEETYLLCHRSGVVARTKTLTPRDPVNGITAIINLKTLEQFVDDKWEKIPEGYASLIEAEEEETVLDEEEESYEDEEAYTPDTIQLGAKRYYNPNIVFAYCKAKLT